MPQATGEGAVRTALGPGQGLPPRRRWGGEGQNPGCRDRQVELLSCLSSPRSQNAIYRNLLLKVFWR